ncbi:MAG TPA: phosphoglycerate dehydrogenase [Pirellulales bacterium]|jgi:phosphoglycerate dehydrogenase-like enzyme|nr:phosphoglycerate dehydrogenase [Pirellulales bacterium]
MPRVLVAPPVFNRKPGPYCEVFDTAGFEMIYPDGDLTYMPAAERIAYLSKVDAVMAGIELYNDEVLDATHLRAIARAGVGYDAIDVPAATRHGVPVCITPGTNEISVAEQTLALVFACFRDLARRDREARQGGWRREPVRRLAGNTLGLVGLGRIGRAIVPRAQALGLKVVAYDPFPNREFAAANSVAIVSLDELLEQSDIVTLHLPCNAETTDLINERTLAKMKPCSVLINTARGGLVDEQALAAALRAGKPAMAGLDVFKQEPPEADNPLLKLDQVVVSPHLGGIDRDAVNAMGKLAAECIVDLHRGRWPAGCVVNDELRAGWTW